MALGRFNFVVQDDAGNIVDGASITVTREANGALAVPYDDSLGIDLLGNPYIAADGADAGFFVVGGTYRIDVVKDGLTRTLRHQPVGTAQGLDVPLTGYITRVHTAAGDVDVLASDVMVIVNKTVGENTNVNIPPAADRDGAPVIIKDGKRDADTHPITPVFDGSNSPAETADGQAGTAFQITTPGGWVRFDPLPDGSGYVAVGSQL